MSNPDSFLSPLYTTLPLELQELFDDHMSAGDIGILLIKDKDELIIELGKEKVPVPSTQDVPKIQNITSQKHQTRYEQLLREFNWQINNLLQKGYPVLANMSQTEFLSYLNPLRERLPELATQEYKKGHIPFVIVIKNKVIGAEKEMPLIELEGKKGYTTMSADEIKGFKPIEGVKIPSGRAYLAIDIETGKTSLDITPDEAIKKIKKEDRSPLTIDEGVALITHHPEILKNHYVWASGSRHGDDDVAILWLYGGEPELDWGWANGSDAEWGSASCGSRVGP